MAVENRPAIEDIKLSTAHSASQTELTQRALTNVTREVKEFRSEVDDLRMRILQKEQDTAGALAHLRQELLQVKSKVTTCEGKLNDVRQRQEDSINNVSSDIAGVRSSLSNQLQEVMERVTELGKALREKEKITNPKRDKGSPKDEKLDDTFRLGNESTRNSSPTCLLDPEASESRITELEELVQRLKEELARNQAEEKVSEYGLEIWIGHRLRSIDCRQKR